MPTQPADGGADFAKKSGQGGTGTSSAVLMICTTNLHFLEADMYGWIRVR